MSRRSGYGKMHKGEKEYTTALTGGHSSNDNLNKSIDQSLSYNNMLMRNDGSVMSKDAIKDLRERNGFCTTCQDEPVKLFEIKKSKINPLFRGKEPIEKIHDAFNGICLRCNPRMDPHRLSRHNSLRRGFSVQSMGSRSISGRSFGTASRSVSPSPPSTPSAPPRVLPPRGHDTAPRSERSLHNANGSMSRGMSEQSFQVHELVQQRSPAIQQSNTPSGNSGGSSSDFITPKPNSASVSSTSSSLASMLASKKPAIDKSQFDEFSMPDFSQSSFKSHRKKSKKREKQGGAPATVLTSRRGSASKVSKPPLKDIMEDKSQRGDWFSNDDAFDDPQFDDVKFGDQPAKKLAQKKPKMQVASKMTNGDIGEIPNKPPLFVDTNRTESGFHQKAFDGFGGTDSSDDDPFDVNQANYASGAAWASESGLHTDTPYSGSDDDMSWPEAPSIAASTTASTTEPKRADSNATTETFLAPPSQASLGGSRSHPYSLGASIRSAVREPSEISLSLTDAVLKISLEEDEFQNSMSPSQLIQADFLLMSGIQGTEKGGAGNNVEEVEALLQDVAAAGNADIMIDMLAGTMRENRNSMSIQEVCLKHIWDHSKFNEAHKAQIMDAGLAEDIVRAMKKYRESTKVQRNACGCLWSLAVNKNNRVLLARAGAVKLVFRALESHIEEEDFLETVFGALRTLSPESEVRQAIIPLLGARRVCRAMALHRACTPIQRDGCAFLSNIAVDMENQMVSVVTTDEIDAVVRALGLHLRNQSVVSSACFALKNYTYEEKNLRALRRFDDIQSLLEDASKYSTKAEIRADAAEISERLQLLGEEDDALEQIAYSSLLDAMKNPTMTVEDAVETIRDVLKQYEWSEKLICYGIGALLSLSRQSEEYLTRIIQFDVLKALVHTMFKQQDNPSIQEYGCQTIKFLAEQGNRPRTMICDVDGSSIIIAALRRHQENESVTAPAVGALEELSKDDRCAKIIERELFGGTGDGANLGASLASIQSNA